MDGASRLAARRGRGDASRGVRPGSRRRIGLALAREPSRASRGSRALLPSARRRARAARREGAVAVLSALCPSAEATVAVASEIAPLRRAWPIVEVVKPGPEGRAPRLVAALKEATRAFLYAPVPGYGIAQVCKACGEPAACAACRGLLRAEEGRVVCAVCGAHGRCANCGARSSGSGVGERSASRNGHRASLGCRRAAREASRGSPPVAPPSWWEDRSRSRTSRRRSSTSSASSTPISPRDARASRRSSARSRRGWRRRHGQGPRDA